MSSPKKALNRPKKRTLVRWDDNLDELLLLTVQSVCNKNAVKIPWAEVADTMGNNVTEGAIVQHLAKLRSRRVSAHKLVPPPLRRGGIGSSKPTGAKRHRKEAAEARSGDGDESPAPMLIIDHSSDEDYVEGRKLKARKKRRSRAKSQPLDDVSIKIEPESEDESRSECEFLVPGAAFLALSNDRSAVSSTSPSDETEESEESEESDVEDSKLVVLKYRARHGEKSMAPSTNQSASEPTPQTSQMNNVFDNALSQAPTPYNSHTRYGSGWEGNYIMEAGASPVTLAPYNLQYDQGINAFDTSNEVHGLSSFTSQWDTHTFCSGGQPENTSDLSGYDDFFNDHYFYQHGEYLNVSGHEQSS